MKKKMIVLIAFIYIASMLFCGDGVGKKFVEEKFPHLTYSDKECDDSKKKELRIVEDEDTAGGILSYEELAAMENENASVRNNMLPDTDQLAFVDEAEKNGELAELEEQQNVKMPQVDMSFDNLVKNYYQNSVPDSLIEAAQLDGASELKIFFKVMLPLAVPTVATISLFTGICYWNDWTNGLYYISNEKLYSIQQLLMKIMNNIQAMRSSSNAALIGTGAIDLPGTSIRMAMAVIGILPIMLIYPFVQKYLVKGVVVGAVKG